MMKEWCHSEFARVKHASYPLPPVSVVSESLLFHEDSPSHMIIAVALSLSGPPEPLSLVNLL